MWISCLGCCSGGALLGRLSVVLGRGPFQDCLVFDLLVAALSVEMSCHCFQLDCLCYSLSEHCRSRCGTFDRVSGCCVGQVPCCLFPIFLAALVGLRVSPYESRMFLSFL